MDKNQLAGLTLIAVILITYTHFFASKPPVQPIAIQEQQATAVAEEVLPYQALSSRLGHAIPANAAQYGIFFPATQGNEKELVLENEVMKVTLTSLGGRVKQVVLKKYKDHQGQLLVLLDEQSSDIGFELAIHGIQLNTNALFFETADQGQRIEGTAWAKASFTLPIGPGQYIRHVFSLPGKGYTLEHEWKMVGLGTALDQEPIKFVWNDRVKRAEKDIDACRNKTTINYYLAEGKFDHLDERSESKREKSLQSPVHWIGIKQRFFTAAIIAQEAFSSGYIAMTPFPVSMNTVKEVQVRLSLPSADPSQDKRAKFTFYFGPNDYQTLSQVTKGFSKNISLGWPIVRWINQFLIIPTFAFLEQYISSYGIIIILLVILIKFLLLPLSYKSYMAIAKMRVLKPALDTIKAKHGDNMQKIQLEQMNLYREMGINPLSGCIPVLLQMPILLAMFNFFPNAIALRQQAFLWASDLSTYDAVIHLPFTIPVYGNHVSLFTLLMTASTILYTWSNDQLTPPQGPMKVIAYLMPVTFMFILNNLPAGLNFYYFVSNLVTFGQQSLIKRFVDEEKIKKKLQENKEKGKDKKKSRFQLRLESIKTARESKEKSTKGNKPNK